MMHGGKHGEPYTDYVNSTVYTEQCFASALLMLSNVL